jgi:signal transduction histidine kinase
MLNLESTQPFALTTQSLEGRRRTIVRLLAMYALVGGLVSLMGWAADVPRLASWDNSGLSIQPNAAVAAITMGVALLLLEASFRRTALILGIGVAAIGASTWFQILTSINLEALNTALMFDRPWGRGGVIYPGRMGPPGATCWTLLGIGIAVVSLNRKSAARKFGPQIAMFTFSVAALSVVGYLFRVDTLFSIPTISIIALQTSTFIAACSMALIAAVPEQSPMRWLLDDGATGSVARRAVPIVMLGPFVIGFIRLVGETRGWYETRFGIALYVVMLTILLLVMLAWSLNTISRHEHSLREADRRKNEFLATLAHELRGPLSPMLNSLELLDRRGTDPATVQKASSIMHRQLAQMVRLVDDLLDVGRISRDKIELQMETVDLRLIIEQAKESCDPLLQSLHHEFTMTLPDEPIVLHADAARLVQVFGNLFNNACKYTPANGRIEFSAARIGGDAVLRVKDSGIGIPPDKLAEVFEMFAQVGRSLEQQHGGLGIGLFLVRRIVLLHGGSIEAHSDGLNRGSEFVVRLAVAR